MSSLPIFDQTNDHDSVQYQKGPQKRSIITVLSIFSMAMIVSLFGYMGQPAIERPNRRMTIALNPEAFEQEYYNVNIEDKFTTAKLSTEHYPVGEGSVIAIYITPNDVEQVQVALRSLAFLQGDAHQKYLAPVLLFNVGNIPEDIMMQIASCTDRPVGFPVVNFQSMSETISQHHKNEHESWDYHFMRFWVTMIWKEPSIQRFDTVMRMDSDSCFKQVNDHLPKFQNEFLYYHSPFQGLTQSSNTNFLFSFVKSWMKHHQEPAEPQNQLLFDYAVSSWENKQILPAFQTSLELSRLSFMQQHDVAQFYEAITENAPFPMLKNGWDDTVLRFFTLSIFASEDRLMASPIEGYVHKDRMSCSIEEVDRALRDHDIFEKVAISR